MLPRRAIRASSRHSLNSLRCCCRRASSSAATAASDVTSKARAKQPEWYGSISAEKQFEIDAGRETPGDRSAIVRLWQLIPNMADAMAAVREIERTYGPISEFRLFKDINVPAQYQAIIRVRFQHPSSVARLRQDTVMHIPLGSAVPVDRPGGIGLDELDGLAAFEPAPFDPDVLATEGHADAVPQSERLIDARIESSHEVFTMGSRSYRGRNSPYIGRQFVAWGGFAPVKPMPKSVPITHDSLPDRPYMRLALRRWAERAGVPNPYEKESDIPIDVKADRDADGWEALPDLSEELPSAEDEHPLLSPSSSLEDTALPSLQPEAIDSSYTPLPSDSSAQGATEATQPPIEPVLTPHSRPTGSKPKKVVTQTVILPSTSSSTNRLTHQQRPQIDAEKLAAFEKRVAAMSEQASQQHQKQKEAAKRNAVLEKARKEMLAEEPGETRASPQGNTLVNKLKHMFTW